MALNGNQIASTIKSKLQKIDLSHRASSYYANGLKVTKTNNPFVFPAENTYQVGSAEIVAMMSNTIAVGTGQTGAAPLYVFNKDGVYGLFVDASGQMTYTNARVLARDVCNERKSVTPIDEGVAFTTDRGLMLIAGEEIIEIGQALEGEVFDMTDSSDSAKVALLHNFTLTKRANLPSAMHDRVDFRQFIKSGCIINYNHNERELMVSNNSLLQNGTRKYPYTYIFDSNHQWSRRNFTADEYVNNYPTSYRVIDGVFYKVDEEQNGLDTANNGIFVLSQVVKLNSIGFKQAYRFVVRGYFHTYKSGTSDANQPYLYLTILGSYDGRKWAVLGWNKKQSKSSTKGFTDFGCKIERTDVRFFRFCLAGYWDKDSRLDYMEISADPSMLNTKIR